MGEEKGVEVLTTLLLSLPPPHCAPAVWEDLMKELMVSCCSLDPFPGCSRCVMAGDTERSAGEMNTVSLGCWGGTWMRVDRSLYVVPPLVPAPEPEPAAAAAAAAMAEVLLAVLPMLAK